MNFINALYKLFSFDITNPISFNSGAFLLFFTIFILIYAFLYRYKIIRNILILTFSLFIYYKLTGWYLLVMILTLIIDYLLAIAIYKSKEKKKKLIFAAISICASLGLLIYFKYTNFFIQSLSNITGGKFTLLNIIVPLGISFYTFRTISYIIDVYREDMKPTFNILDYAVYMTFFPLLISGPISRAKSFLPQVKKRFSIKDDKINRAIFLIIIGLIKKAVVADYIGQYCNLIFDAPGTYSGFENLIAVYAFALQIYFDFSGYTDMAIGLAKLMGFDIGTNFNKPYNSLNVTEFWRRWHISLSSWLRDYLFSPLSIRFRNWGNAGLVLSLFLTFVLCGFWHGANWTYVVWGALFGAVMAMEILFAKQRKKIKKKVNKRVYNFLSWFLTFNFVAFLWIFFRSKDMETAGQMYYQIFHQLDWAYLQPFLSVRSLLVIFIILGFALTAIPSKWYPAITERFISMPLWAKAIVFLAAVQLVIQFQSADVQPFLYAQF
jgi:D-alanyl-lipoteichoic acid acyltransferase DltB (MBOAT superfamily)